MAQDNKVDEYIEEVYGKNYPVLVEDERDFWRPGK